jgi:hypothetical protein
MSPVREIRYPHYRKWAEEALAVAEGVQRDWPPEVDPMDVFGGVVHSICLAQTERLRAALVLDDAGLGNHATPYVRLAYEETLWLSYLATIEDNSLRNDLLLTMVQVDKAQRVSTQRDYFGDREARITGITAEAHEELRPKIITVLGLLEDVAQRLGWERRPNSPHKYRGAPPKLDWIASRITSDFPTPHGYLAECSSQYVHFSAFQAIRGIKAGTDGRAVHADQMQREIDTGFALGWATYLLAYAYLRAKEWLSPRLDLEQGEDRWWHLKMERILKDLRTYGEPPLIYGADLMTSSAT